MSEQRDKLLAIWMLNTLRSVTCVQKHSIVSWIWRERERWGVRCVTVIHLERDLLGRRCLIPLPPAAPTPPPPMVVVPLYSTERERLRRLFSRDLERTLCFLFERSRSLARLRRTGDRDLLLLLDLPMIV
jgi:hypothetical protein